MLEIVLTRWYFLKEYMHDEVGKDCPSASFRKFRRSAGEIERRSLRRKASSRVYLLRRCGPISSEASTGLRPE